MAGFAVQLAAVQDLQRPLPLFSVTSERGYLESDFLRKVRVLK
jgi:hypothetical protein